MGVEPKIGVPLLRKKHQDVFLTRKTPAIRLFLFNPPTLILVAKKRSPNLPMKLGVAHCCYGIGCQLYPGVGKFSRWETYFLVEDVNMTNMGEPIMDFVWINQTSRCYPGGFVVFRWRSKIVEHGECFEKRWKWKVENLVVFLGRISSRSLTDEIHLVTCEVISTCWKTMTFSD